jgi:serine protease Do
MKTKHSKFITAGLAALMVAPALAIEGPADDAPPPPQVEKQEPASLPQFKLPPDDKPAAPVREIAKTDTAFLGVVSGEVPQFLAEHLDLGKGRGILVRSTAPDSPASRSGIAVNDVITAVAGHPIGTQAELSKQITAHKPGEVVALDVIHKGKPVRIDVTLAVKPESIAMTEPPAIEDMNLESLPKEMADHIRDAIGGLDLNLGNDPNAVPAQMEERSANSTSV